MRWLGLVLMIVAVGCGAFALGWNLSHRLSPTTQATEAANSPVPQSSEPAPVNKVVAQGRLVPYGGIFNVIAPPGQRIDRLLVHVGADVTAGETQLAVLSGDPLLRKQIELAESRTADARRELELQYLQANNQYLAAQAALETARLNLLQAREQQDFSIQEKRIEQAEAKLARYERLLRDEQTARLVSTYDLEDQRLGLEAARLQLAQAKRLAHQSVSAAELAVANAEQQLVAARQSREAAEEALRHMRTAELGEEIAQLQWESQQLFAPVNGKVIRVFVKEGEVVQNTPLLQIGDLNRMECVAEVVDRLANQVREGQKAIVKSPALGEPLNGRVTRVESLVGAATLMDPNPLAMMDRRTVEVRIELDEESTQRARRFINLQVTVEIATGSAGDSF